MNTLRLELSAIKLSLESVDRFKLLHPDLFLTPQVKELYNEVFKIYQEEGELPSLIKLELKIKEEGKLMKFQELIDSMNNLDVKDEDYELVIKHLHENKLTAAMKDHIHNAGQKLAAKDIPGTIEVLKTCLEETTQNLSRVDNSFFSIGAYSKSEAKEDDVFRDEYFIPTGFTELDKRIIGLAKNEFIIFAAPKGSGKSAFSLMIGLNAYHAEASVVYCNFEMSYRDWLHRYLTAVSGIPFTKIRSKNLTTDEWFHLKKSFIKDHYTLDAQDEIDRICEKNRKKLEKIDLFIAAQVFTKKVHPEKVRKNHYSVLENFRPTTTELMIELERLRSLKGLDLVIIDYISFLRHPNEKLPSWEKLKDIAVQLKSMAKTLDCAFLVLAQLEEKEQDTKYSRGITESSDLAIAWQFKEQINEETSIYELYSIKGRFTGRIRNMELVANVERMQFDIRRSLE